MISLLWAALAGTLAVAIEVAFRKGVDWPGHTYIFVPLAILLNYLVFRTVTSGGSLIIAVAGFSLFTILARVLASQFVLGEAVTKGNLVAAAALVIGVVVGHLWK